MLSLNHLLGLLRGGLLHGIGVGKSVSKFSREQSYFSFVDAWAALRFVGITNSEIRRRNRCDEMRGDVYVHIENKTEE